MNGRHLQPVNTSAVLDRIEYVTPDRRGHYPLTMEPGDIKVIGRAGHIRPTGPDGCEDRETSRQAVAVERAHTGFLATIYENTGPVEYNGRRVEGPFPRQVGLVPGDSIRLITNGGYYHQYTFHFSVPDVGPQLLAPGAAGTTPVEIEPVYRFEGEDRMYAAAVFSYTENTDRQAPPVRQWPTYDQIARMRHHFQVHHLGFPSDTPVPSGGSCQQHLRLLRSKIAERLDTAEPESVVAGLALLISSDDSLRDQIDVALIDELFEAVPPGGTIGGHDG